MTWCSADIEQCEFLGGGRLVKDCTIDSKLPPFCAQCVTALARCQQHAKCWRSWGFLYWEQGWNFGRFLVLLGFRRLYSLSGKYSPSISFPIEPEIPGTQSTRLRPQFHTESPIGKPKILKRQTHGITTKAYRPV